MTTGIYTSSCNFVKDIPFRFTNAFSLAKTDTNTWAQVLDFTANGMQLIQRSLNTTKFNTTIRTFGNSGAVLEMVQIGGTLTYLGKLALSCGRGNCREKQTVRNFVERFHLNNMGMEGRYFNEDQTAVDFIRETAFGAANFCVALLWMDDHQLIDLRKFSIQSVGRVVTFSGVITTGAVVGLMMLSLETINALKSEEGLTKNERFSKQCSLAWSVSEIALIIIPFTAFAPAAPWMIAGSMFAKSAGIASFIYSKN